MIKSCQDSSTHHGHFLPSSPLTLVKPVAKHTRRHEVYGGDLITHDHNQMNEFASNSLWSGILVITAGAINILIVSMLRDPKPEILNKVTTRFLA